MPRHTDRCSGHCCENFSLPASPEELEANYRRWAAYGDPVGMNDHKPKTWYQDIHLIYPMVVYLGYTAETPPKVNLTDEQLLGNPKPQFHRYRCKHLDPETRDCTIYEIRPQMCRSYPDGQGCNYAECTWEEVKQTPNTPEELERRKAALIPLDNEIKVEKPKPKPVPCGICQGVCPPPIGARVCSACKLVVCPECWNQDQSRCNACLEKVEDVNNLNLTCAVCPKVVSFDDAHRCVGCDSMVCSDCWNSKVDRCVRCYRRPESELKIIDVRCAICAKTVVSSNSFTCGGCLETVCARCWSKDQKRCDNCLSHVERTTCKVCGNRVVVKLTHTCEQCHKRVCADCLTGKRCVACQAKVTSCKVCGKRPTPPKGLHTCGKCHWVVCSDCWDAPHNLCAECIAIEESDPTLELSQALCTACAKAVKHTHTYRCPECDSLVCGDCWRLTKCVRCVK